MQIIPGDILLVKSTGFIADEIEHITKSPYAHVALFKTPDRLIEANGFRRVGYQDPAIYRGHSDVFRLRGISLAERLHIVDNAESQIGCNYDYPLLGVEFLRFIIGITIPWHEFHCRICSTLVADSFRAAGFDLLPGMSYPAPGDIPKSLLLDQEGAYE